MKTSVLLASLLAVATFVACGKSASSAPAATTAAPATTSSATAAPTASTDLPASCQEYLNLVSACVSKAGGAAAEAMKQAMEQTRATWNTLGANRDILDAACKQAIDTVKPQLLTMNCQ